MNSFIFALTAVSPIVITVALGYFLKRIGFMDSDFAKKANKLVFRLFLPSMLFLNVYNISDIGSIDLGYVLYVLLALLTVFLIALPFVLLITKENRKRGALLQATFRSNYALIGIPLATSLFGEEGAIVATILSAFTIPLLNILAVISLSVFREDEKKASIRGILLGIAQNPLIISVLLGVFAIGIRSVFAKYQIAFRLSDIKPIFTVLKYLSGMATPLALLVLGAQFEFSAIASLKKEILFGTFARTVFVPILGIGAAFLFFRNTFTGAHFSAFVAIFATPVAVSSVPMAQEMNSDSALAGQLVVWSTLISAFTVFLVSFLLKLAGIF